VACILGGVIGERIADRFVLRAVAGKGGMGTVYRADDARSGGAVALKLLDGRDAIDAARFHREALALERLAHPNVVRLVDHGDDEGRAYLAMEWLDGVPLDVFLMQRAPTVHEAIAIARAAAAGLGAAHREGIVHRDVKPANLFLVGGEPADVRVLDFGIARSLAAGHTVTQSGTVVGTPFYMAPEQARARGGVDARADVYALGAVLYELLSGAPPFKSESLMAVLAAILMELPADIRERARVDVPEALAGLVMELLSKRADERPVDGDALARRLGSLDAGTPSTPSTAPPALTEREQRMLCLVLVAAPSDPGATGATQTMGASDAMGRVRATVEAHGGRAELLADGSLVGQMEGANPTDQAVHAARCAQALRALALELPIAIVSGRGQIQGRLPIGEVIERGGVLLDRAVVGATTLRQGALGGAAPDAPAELPVRLDEDTAALLEGRFEIAVTPRGRELGEEVGSTTTIETRPPCLGRRRELASLGALYEEAVEEPIARCALITGGAGMGKSHLIAELLDRWREAGEADLWIARGDPVAPGSPFGLVAQLIRHACGIRQGEALEVRRDKLVSTLEQTLPPDEALAAARRLGELARVPFEAPSRSIAPPDAHSRGDAMRDALLSWLDRVTQRRPLVIVLDDLQWGDRPSLSFMDAALRELAGAPLLVLGAGRPELTDEFGDLWADRDAQPIRLAKLRPKPSGELVRHRLPDADDALVGRLVERADGNPFFLEELARALAEGEGEEGLPATVLGMVEARLAVLEPSTRRVLRAGSVFGRRFWRGGVIELLGGDGRAGDVDGHLSVLVDREVVDRVSPTRFPGQVELGFRHATTRRAAHAMLTDEDRRLGHRLAGAWLERAGETDALVLAEHYERGRDPGRAARWLGLAAEQALEGDDLAGAVARAERALAMAEDDATRGPVLVTLCDALRWRGDYEAAFARAEEAARAVAEGSRAWFRALGVIFAAALRLRRLLDGEAWRQRAMDAMADDDAAGSHVVALCRAATLVLADERARFEATMALAERVGRERAPDDARAHAWIATLRASDALRQGDQGAFVDGTEEAVQGYTAAGDLRDACNQRVRLGNAYVSLGDAARAVGVLRDALASARRMGLRVIEGYALQNLGNALMRAGELDEAHAIEERAIELARALDDGVLEAGCLLYRSEARLSGDPAGAQRDAARALELLGAIPGFRAVARAALARAQLTLGQGELALAAATQAAAEAAQASPEEGQALIDRVHVEALRHAGRADEASAVAQAAAQRLRARADRITDGGWRDSFLHRVPHHARLLALAEA